MLTICMVGVHLQNLVTARKVERRQDWAYMIIIYSWRQFCFVYMREVIMNGLSFVRKRCNYNMTELADKLRVTRQAISMWESGKRAIPKYRRKELTEIFGVEDKYLDELTDEDIKELVTSPMFEYYEGDKQKFSFKPIPDGGENNLWIHFYSEDAKYTDEDLNECIKRKNEVLKDIDKFIVGKAVERNTDKMVQIERGCDSYNHISNILGHMDDYPIHKRMPFYLIADMAWEGIEVGLGLKDEETVHEKYGDWKLEDTYNEVFLEVVKLVKKNWDITSQELDEWDRKWREKRRKEKERIRQVTSGPIPINLAERIKEATDKYRTSEEKHDIVGTYLGD